jgi:ent-kaurenoic acid hydroxylase
LFFHHLQARRKLIKILQAVVDERRARKRNDWESDDEKKDMMELLMEVEYENGEKLEDEEIIDVILMYLNAGHESSAHATMWATLFLHQHPECLHKAKVRGCKFLLPCIWDAANSSILQYWNLFF